MEGVPETDKIVRKVTPEGKLINQYLKLKKIGEGPYSKIKLMKNILDGKLYAMKKYNLFILKKKNKLLKKEHGQRKTISYQAIYTTAAEEVLREVQILKLIKHPNIAELVEIIRDREEEKLYLFLEYCEKGDIAVWSSSKEKFTLNSELASVEALRRSFIQIAKGVQYLHCNDIVHRDIKPQNILINGQLEVKIIDFGRAVKLSNSQQKLRGSEGTYHFMAPQMLSEVFKEGYDGKQCDMWSLGVTFYCILFGTLPFYHELLIKLFEQIQKGEYQIPKVYPPSYEVFLPLVKGLLKVDPRERLTVQQLLGELQGKK